MKRHKDLTTIKKWLEEEGELTSVCPITHNPGLVILQFCGWSITLKTDGDWYLEDTTGG